MYGLRLRIEYRDINEILTRINIYQDGYNGAADIRSANAGLKIEWGDQASTEMPLIYGSSCTVYFDAEYDFEFLYLFSSDAKKHRMDIEKAGTVIWTGFIEPDSWNEPLVSTPYAVEVTAYDNLGFLNDIDYVPDGRKTVDIILTEILAITGLNLPKNVDIDWTNTVGEGLLTHNIDTSIYDEMSCYEVLEQLFKCCLVYQRAAQWWIKSNTKLSKLPVSVNDYWMEGQAEMQILPAIKQITVKQDFGYNENLVGNGSFGSFNNENKVFDGWENIDVTPEQRDLNKEGDKYVYIPGKEYHGNLGWGWLVKGIRKTMPVNESTSVLKVSLKYALLGLAAATATSATMMFIRVRLIGSTTTYILRRRPYVAEKQEFQWVPQSGVPASEHSIPLGSHLKKSKDVDIQVNGVWQDAYYNVHDKTRAYKFDTIADHFETFTATVEGIPESGLFEIILYVPYDDAPEIGGSCYTGVKVELLDENEEEYPVEQSIKVVNNERNNYSPSEFTLVQGDYPDIINNKVIYSGGFRRASDVTSKGWGLAGSTYVYTFAELIARIYVGSQRVPRQSYNARLADIIPTSLIVFTDPNNPGKKFIENGISYDDRFQAVEGQFTELIDISIDDLNVENTTLRVRPKKFDVYATTTRTENIESRVTVVDLKSAIISAPSHMDGEYFEGIPGDDGYSRIRPIRRPQIVPFENTDCPSINNYNDAFEPIYGQFPTARLFTIDELGNRIARTEQAYFTIDQETKLITAITFPNLDGPQSGFILLI